MKINNRLLNNYSGEINKNNEKIIDFEKKLKEILNEKYENSNKEGNVLSLQEKYFKTILNLIS